MNLVKLITDQFSDETLGKLSAQLGTDPTRPAQRLPRPCRRCCRVWPAWPPVVKVPGNWPTC
jgi:hypothetical protein